MMKIAMVAMKKMMIITILLILILPLTLLCIAITNIYQHRELSFMSLIIEVRDSRTAYLVSGRDGPGLLLDPESCWDIAVAAAAVPAPTHLFYRSIWFVFQCFQVPR